MNQWQKKIEAAYERIQPYVRKTFLEYSEAISQITDCNVYLKCENLQKIGT